jgi:hypothetical protein
MATWELEAGAVRQTLEAWGLSDLRLTRRSLAADEATCMGPQALDAAPLFSFRQAVTIWRDGVRWFQGAVELAPGTGAGQRESRSYQFLGPWAYLERLVYRQLWASWSGSSVTNVRQSRVILNQNQNRTPMTTAAQITDVVNWAITCGRPLALGTVDVDLTQLSDELRNPTCAEVITRLLRVQPDVVSRIDYSPETPVIHFTRTAVQTPVVLDPNDADRLRQITCTARPDMQVPAVVIEYEKTHEDGGNSYRTIQRDVWPVGATGNEDGAVVLSQELEGSNVTREKVIINRRNIPNSWNSLGVLTWWRKHVPWLKEAGVPPLADPIPIPLEDLSIPTGQHRLRLADLDAVNADRAARGLAALSEAAGQDLAESMTHELIEGGITEWMQQSPYNVEVCDIVISARIHYNGDNEDLRRLFNYDLDSGAWWTDVAVTCRGTNADQRVYQRVTSSSPGEAAPTGLAQKIYESARALTHEGSFTIVGDEPETGWRPGVVVDLTGIGGGIAQTTTEEADTGAVTVNFGPPAHRTLADMIELLRAGRTRDISRSSQARETGKSTDEGTTVQQVKATSGQDSAPQPVNNTRKTFAIDEERTLEVDAENGLIILLDSSGETAKEIRIRLADIPAAAAAAGAVELRELDYCDGTTAKKILVLASAPYTA